VGGGVEGKGRKVRSRRKAQRGGGGRERRVQQGGRDGKESVRAIGFHGADV